MAHQRQVIREAAKAQLLDKTAAGPHVFETRKVPYKRLTLPAIAVYSGDESSTDQGSAPRELKRTLQLAIEAVVKEGANVDDSMDSIAEEIERAIHVDPTFGGKASDAVLSSTSLDVDEIADQPVGLVRLVYSVTYYTDAPAAADVTLDDLKTVDVKTNLGGTVHPADQAEDRLENLDQ